MTTAREIITTSLRRIGAVESGEGPSADEAQDALVLLNDILDSWSLEHLLVLGQTITTKVLTAGQQSYTIGAGGQINIAWPADIEQAHVRDLTQPDPLDIPLRILTDTEYAAIGIKTLESTYPEYLWFNRTFPLGALFLSPVPSAGHTLVLWTRGVVASFATLDTDVQLGRGYARALRYALALELCAEYGREVPVGVAAGAVDALATIKRANITRQRATIEVPGGRTTMHSWDWRTGGG